MPNHCVNKLRLGKLTPELISDITRNSNICQVMRPMPKDIANTTVGSHGLDSSDPLGWYGWAHQNWGTKWGAYATYIEEQGEDFIVLKFETAWSPPIKFYEYLEEQGYDAHAFYVEQGCDFIGIYDAGEDYVLDLSPLVKEHEEGLEPAIERFVKEYTVFTMDYIHAGG